MERERIDYLLNAYTSGKITDQEEAELMEWVLEAEHDDSLKDYMLEIWNAHHTSEEYDHVDWEGIYETIIPPSTWKTTRSGGRVKRIIWTVAASVAVAFMVAYFYINSDKDEHVATVEQLEKDVAPPSGNKAILVLADGTKIEMDSTSGDIIAAQGNVRIVRNADGVISYTSKSGNVLEYNSFEVPKGSKPLSLMLVDGSKVWLNSGSKITFPTAFVGKERKVTMEGEAYFEVAHNASMPFKVVNGEVEIRVLGTHFNVNGYREDGQEKITLLEGAVEVNHQNETRKLSPGQQALVSGNGNNIKVHRDVDLKEVMAWRDGKFVFNPDMDIHNIMNQLARWYNVEVEYKGVVNQRFWGSISKDVNLSEVLKILEATGGVKFEIEGNKIAVLPAAIINM